MDSQSHAPADAAIAVIGMAGRFPGANSIDELWRNLRGGVESVSFFSDEELLRSGVDPAELRDPAYVKASAVVEGIEYFDAGFFGYTPLEADIMDPQQRLFLECAWEAFESAGYDPAACAGRVGVYAGCTPSLYWLDNLVADGRVAAAASDFQILLANDKDYLATRVSYKLNLRGPSVGVQTACSTSLVAVHLARQALIHGDCDLALAGGVTLNVPPRRGYIYREGGISSPDGHTRPFDWRARGCAKGNGVAVVLLRRLRDALAARDFIHAVIRGSAVNNDGGLKVGFTAPAVEGQAEVIRNALAAAGVAPETIAYIEAHGTATELGDPIEIAALGKAFGPAGDSRKSCAIGSIKSNMGHLNAAAGAAGLIKAVLALRHREIPPSLHFERPNSRIDLAATPFFVNTRLLDWKRGPAPRRAGVSSFGIGGTNAHVVLEEAPAVAAGERGTPWHLLPLSARTEAALQSARQRLAEHLRLHPDLDLEDAAYTLQTGRRPFPHRMAVVCSSAADAVQALEDGQRQIVGHIPNAGGRKLAFLFPGQGAQYAGMGAQLYETQAVFREQIDYCAETLRASLGLDLRRLILGGEKAIPDLEAQLEETWLAQPALFVVEYSLARLLMKAGLFTDGLIGHSLGEYVAACVAGTMPLDSALRLVAARGKIMHGAPAGAMLAVGLPEEQARALLDGGLSLAAHNEPCGCVISGPAPAIETVQRRLDAQGIPARRLGVSRAFHSSMMEGVLGRFRTELEGIELRPPLIPFISNVTGAWIGSADATDPAYWVRHLRQTVRFSEGVKVLAGDSAYAFLEAGPGHTLASLVRRNLKPAEGRLIISCLPGRNEAGQDLSTLWAGVGKLWTSGVRVDWAALHAGRTRRRVPLPTYPFEKEYHWIQPRRLLQPRPSPLEPQASPLVAPSWRRDTHPACASAPELAHLAPSWLVFADRGGIGAAVSRRLQDAGHSVTTVTVGPTFARLADRRYALNPRQPGDYTSLAEELGRLPDPPRAVLHCWSISTAGQGHPGLDGLEETYYRGLGSALALLAAIEGRAATTPECWIVSDHLLSVTGEETLNPAKALVLAMRDAPLQPPCRYIDIAVPDANTVCLDTVADGILAGLAAPSAPPVLALRGRHAWTPAVEPLAGDCSGAGRDASRRRSIAVLNALRPAGLAVAEALLETCDARLHIGAQPAGQADAALGFDLSLREQIAEVRELETTALLSRGEPERERVMNFTEAVTPLCARYVYDLLQRSCGAVGPGARVAETQLREAVGLLPKFIRFFEFLLDTVAAAGLIVREQGWVEFLPRLSDLPDGCALHARLAAEYPDFRDQLEHLRFCAERYPAVLSGREEALAVLYPEGRPNQVTAETGSSFPDARVYHQVTANWLGALSRRMDRKMTILEVGGGSGYLTWPLLEKLHQPNVEYCFTDLGRSFVLNARNKARERGLGCMSFGVLDISRDPAAQGFAGRQFDVILAYNVVHATRSVLETITWLGSLLAPGGILVLVELAPMPPWIVMQSGLAEGFWFFEDLAVRPSSPLLSPNQWETVLGGAGFKTVAVFPEDAQRRSNVDHALVIAQRDPTPGLLPGRLEALESRGAEIVRIPECGIAQQVRALRSRMRPGAALDGVVFVQGLDQAHRGTAERLKPEALLERLRPAIRELFSLETVLGENPPEFVWIVSAPKRGDEDRLADAALASFTDAFAADRAARGPVRWTSIHIAGPVGDGEPRNLSRLFGTLLLPGAPSVATVQSGSGRVPPTQGPASAAPAPRFSQGPDDRAEEVLAAIWKKALGLESVGIHDEFAALGGDSLMSIQISNLARQEGLDVSSQQILEQRTIAAIAASLRASAPPAPLAESASGPAPLTGAQQAFFEGDPTDRHHFNAAVLWETDARLPLETWREIIGELLRHHDALRLRFVEEGGCWRQQVAPPGGAVPFLSICVSDLEEGTRRRAIEAVAAELQGTLDLAQGPIVRLAHFDLGQEQPGRLLLIVHHLAADRVSFEVLREDLERSCAQIRRAEPIRFPPATAAFRTWVERTAEVARGGAFDHEWSYWLNERRMRVHPVPLDLPDGANTVGSTRFAFATVEQQDMELLRTLPTHGATARGALLASLGLAFRAWFGCPSMLVALIDHGRRDLFGALNVSRTVGLLSTGFPFAVALDAAGAFDVMANVDGELAAVPNWGAGFALLAYLRGDHPDAARLRRLLHRVQVSFNYVSRVASEATGLRPGCEHPGPIISTRRLRQHVLSFTAWTTADQLRLVGEYSSHLHRPETLDRVMSDWRRELVSLLHGAAAGRTQPQHL